MNIKNPFNELLLSLLLVNELEKREKSNSGVIAQISQLNTQKMLKQSLNKKFQI